MRHSTGGDGDVSRATGETYPLPVFLKRTVDGSATEIDESNPLPTSGAGYSSTVTVLRPLNITLYTAGDAIGKDAGVLQVETATAAGTVTAEVAQVETATASGTITAGTAQVETATVVGTVTAGTNQVETATASGSITGDGNATVIVTSALATGSPITLNVPVLNTDTASTWAGKVRTALNLIDAITDHYTVGGAGADITLTALVKAANDATLNISLDNGTCTGITPALSSANTTAGVAPGTGNATVTVTGAGITGSPLAVSVAVVAADNADAVATKIRTALTATAAITAVYTVSGATDKVILTRNSAAANDATLNIAIANGTCTGLTAAPTSADTTAGVAPGTGNATVIVTGSGITGSPLTVSVAVVAGDTAATWAGKVRTALTATAAITALYTVGGAGASITLTRTVPAANDATLNISLDNGTCTGITPALTSANTTAGVAPGTGNATVIVTGANITGSPITLSVAVIQGDTAATWAGKVRTALAANAAIAAVYTVGGATTAITLTAITAAADDATLNISLNNGTCTGITPALTSTSTTAGSTTSATAGDAIIEFTNAGPEGGHIFITDLNLTITNSSAPAGMTTYRMHFYNARPDAILDNAAWDLSSSGDRSKYLGYVDLKQPVDLGSTLYSQNGSFEIGNKKVKLADGSTTLYGVNQTIGSYTPASGTSYSYNLETAA